MPTVDELLARGKSLLDRPGIELPRREAALLLGFVLGMSEAALLAHGRDPVDDGLIARYDDLTARRAGGEPAAYLLGRREFWGRTFAVDRRVLIPRPETEHLVELVLGLPLPASARVVDVGTGSGALAVTLAAERPRWSVWATDLSPAALALARRNALRHGIAGRIRFLAADLLSALDLAGFDLVVSNPPYVDPSLRPHLAPEVSRFEPALALFSSRAGLGALEGLLLQARGLRAGARLACEIGHDQLQAVQRLATASGGWQLEGVQRDLSGRDRTVVWRRAGAAG